MIERAKGKELVRWFAERGDDFQKAFRSHINVGRLAEDRNYGLKLLLFDFAFSRSGAPLAYPIAAVKAVSSANHSGQRLETMFKLFRNRTKRNKGRDGYNKSNNPIFDPGIDKLDIRQVVTLVRDGNLRQAFAELDIRGMGHKIRSLFLRDLVILLAAEQKAKLESQLDEYGVEEAYLLCQPVDVWVRITAEELCRTSRTKRSKTYRLGGRDRAIANALIELAKEAGVSPLKVNAGIWYFSANVVQDEERLRKLIRTGDVRELETELNLMKDFLPVHPKWG